VKIFWPVALAVDFVGFLANEARPFLIRGAMLGRWIQFGRGTESRFCHIVTGDRRLPKRLKSTIPRLSFDAALVQFGMFNRREAEVI
jgi:hypothetical protein